MGKKRNKEKPLKLKSDQKPHNLPRTTENEISDYSHHLTSQIKRLADIGIALSAEHNLDKLLEAILDEARRFTGADAGTLYLLEDKKLNFKILQNDTLAVRMGGTSGETVTLPPVPLNKSNVSAYVAMIGESVNIPDVYEAEGFDFTGPRKYDSETGYRSKSMLVVPLRSHEDETIGVLQLLNAKDPRTGEVIPFSGNFEDLTRSLASQAAVAVTNAKLIRDMEKLIYSIVTVMATAIDERSPYTAGHIKRVAQLGVLMCEVINETGEGCFANMHFNEDGMNEMMLAGWMHDIGKITSPTHIVDKATKLQSIFDRIDLIENRFMLIEALERNGWLIRKMKMIRDSVSLEKVAEQEKTAEKNITLIRDEIDFLKYLNSGGEFVDDEKLERVKEIGKKTFRFNGNLMGYLTKDELENLQIRKGTLLDSEKKIMQDHAALTIRMLEKIPFTKKLANVPRFAGGHHEALDGSGYPQGIKGKDIPMEARILGLVDFYEALTASDRPYKKAMPMEKALVILKSEAENGKLDKDLLDLFINAKVHEKFLAAQKSNKQPAAPELGAGTGTRKKPKQRRRG
ncbi:MAG: HD family phosphohydrolase [bacterium]|nr:MAG: HD family phosphohydrolase [bacterium]